MSRRDITKNIDLSIRAWNPRVNEAALGFETRWTRRALRFHNPKLCEQFEAQLARFEQAVVAGSSTDIDVEGGRLCRAYAVITVELQTARVPDDAYMVGRDAKTGTEIVITATPAAASRARELYPFGVFYTPDEIAELIALDQRAQKITAVKRAFPGAEISNISESEGE